LWAGPSGMAQRSLEGGTAALLRAALPS
jgi:hypothetical protein